MHRVDFFSLSVLLCGLHGGWFFFGVLCRRDQVLLIRSLSFICIHNRLLSSAATVKLIFSLSLSLLPPHAFIFSCFFPVQSPITLPAFQIVPYLSKFIYHFLLDSPSFSSLLTLSFDSVSLFFFS